MTNKYYKEIDNEVVFFTGNILRTETSTIINPNDEQMLNAGWLVYVEPEPTAEELLQIAKRDKLIDVMNYDASTAVNEFSIGGVSMWLDHNVRQLLKTSVEAYETLGESEVTKIFNGVEYTFSPQQWLLMLAMLEVYAANALNTTERHKIAINNLSTVEEVEEYDYTVGYPTKCQF